MSASRVLIFGSRGMLGSDLLKMAPAEFVVQVAERNGNRVDITDRAAVKRALNDARPDIVINAAAFTKVDLAESKTSRATAVNADAPASLAIECRRRGARLVHFSTDYVFPGNAEEPYTESDPTNPINAYGVTKLLGEQAVLRTMSNALVIRTQWLFGWAGNSFPRTMWERAQQRLPTRVVSDQTGRPTYTTDLATATWRLVHAGTEGLCHAANAGTASWFDLALAVFEHLGAADLLSACTTADYPTAARRPQFSVLDTGKLERALGAPLPHWRDALRRFIAELDR